MSKFQDLTPQSVKRLQIGEEIHERQITVTKLAGDERWSVEFMFHRQRVHRNLGLSSDGWTRTRCEEWIFTEKSAIVVGTSSAPKGRKTHTRLRELAKWYLDELEATRGRNILVKRRHVEQRLIPALGNEIVDKLTAGQIGRYTKTRVDDGAQPATINRELATLSHLFTTATKANKIARPPCSMDRLREELTPRFALSHLEVEALRHTAHNDHDPRILLFVEFAIGTSMRQSEISRTRFEDIDWAAGRMVIPRAKGGSRYQPLTSRLVSILRHEQSARPLAEQEGWVFPGRSSSGHIPQFNEGLRRVVIAAGLCPRRVTPHLFRHTVVTRLAEQGVGIGVIQKISGHKTPQMVMRYTHITDPFVGQAMRLLDDNQGASYTEITQASK